MLSIEEKAASLGIGVFAGLAEPVRMAMAARMGEREFAGGETLFLEGEPGEEVYLVVSGAVEIVRGNAVLATLEAGEIFGEMAVLGEGVRTAGGRARGETRVLFLRDKALRILFQEIPELPFAICRTLIKRLGEVNDLAVFLSGERKPLGYAAVAGGDLAGREFPILRNDVIIGRRLGSLVEDGLRLALPTADPAVAIRHARLTLAVNGFGIEPLDGEVRLGGETLDEAILLDPGEEIEMGGLRLRFELAGSGGEA
jgi:CRP-like cAMP-binding protein